MTDRRPAARRPSPRAVLWGSVALFAVLFALLTYQLSSGADPSLSGSTATARPLQVRKVIKRRIVTTIVPTPGANSVVSGPATSAPFGASAEPVTTSAS
jgi:hypothetical protein